MSHDPALSSLPLHLPRLLEIHEVAYYLKCSHEQVRRLIRKKRLVAVRLGTRALRVKLTDLEAFVEAQRLAHDQQEHPDLRVREARRA